MCIRVFKCTSFNFSNMADALTAVGTSAFFHYEIKIFSLVFPNSMIKKWRTKPVRSLWSINNWKKCFRDPNSAIKMVMIVFCFDTFLRTLLRCQFLFFMFFVCISTNFCLCNTVVQVLHDKGLQKTHFFRIFFFVFKFSNQKKVSLDEGALNMWWLRNVFV